MPFVTRNNHWRSLLIGLMIFGGTFASAISARAQDDELTEKFDEIAAEVSDIRGLPIEQEVVEDFLPREELQAQLLEDFEEEYPEAEREADQQLLVAFGLIPEGTDLGQLYLDLYTEQIAGYYDPEADELVVIAGDDDLSALDEVTYAHEVTHALQDQGYDLETLREPYEANDDALLAITALIEGDATAVQLDYLLSHPALLARFTIEAGQMGDMPELDNAPPVIREALLFPYDGGQVFVAALQEEGGYDAVDAAYADLPLSTEQILHPEKYIDERDAPTDVSLPELLPVLGQDWEQLDENNFGEFQIRVMLEGEMSNGAAEDAAAGWDGDRYAFYTNDGEYVIVWQSIWDSEEDASEFAAALQAYDEARFDAAYTGTETLALDTDENSARLVVDDAMVSYVLATDANRADEALVEMTS
jgi:predicted transcriptional regulator